MYIDLHRGGSPLTKHLKDNVFKLFRVFASHIQAHYHQTGQELKPIVRVRLKLKYIYMFVDVSQLHLGGFEN